jgi:hypothetical protein
MYAWDRCISNLSGHKTTPFFKKKKKKKKEEETLQNIP